MDRQARRRGPVVYCLEETDNGAVRDLCAGEGTIVTKLSFMPDVEVTCPTCKGARYNQETLEVTLNGRNIAEILDMSIEEGGERIYKELLAVANGQYTYTELYRTAQSTIGVAGASF